MGCVVTPVYSDWTTQFPMLAPYINEAQFDSCFVLAQLYQANDGCGPINDCTLALTLMYLMISFIAVLTYPTTGPTATPDPASPLVGRVSNATEGSVSVAAQYEQPPGTAQFFAQNQWGALWWSATSQFRTFRYAPGPTARGPYGPFGFVRGRVGYGGF